MNLENVGRKIEGYERNSIWKFVYFSKGNPMWLFVWRFMYNFAENPMNFGLMDAIRQERGR